jgi:hemolysin activation/secretion protein
MGAMAVTVLCPVPAAVAQTAPNPAAAGAEGIARDQARQAAAAQAADRAARENAPTARLNAGGAGALGPFPTETPCFPIKSAVVEGQLPRRLRWVGRRLARFEGRCVGHAGLNYILKSLEADFVARGLVTTRAGLPQQDLASGVLKVVVVPGIVAGVRGGTPKDRRAWWMASPLHKGDLVSLRAMEQGLEQERRVPGAQVAVDLAPGERPGDTLFELKAKSAPPITASVSFNNLAGAALNNWQGSGQFGLNDVLGLNEMLSAWYNSRVSNPAIPADSISSGGGLNIPFGWWTFGVTGSESHYRQEVIGQVQDFESSNTLTTIAATAEAVVHRDQTSRTSLQLQVQRRWGRSYIDGVEIALQHQDLTDLQIALLDRRDVGHTHIESQLAFRQGVGLFGAQNDQPGQPDDLPSARYGIATVDVAATTQISPVLNYRGTVRGQFADRTLFGPDQFSTGGPYTVRGYSSDKAILGRSGFYFRQELDWRAQAWVSPYALLDIGKVYGNAATPVGAGLGLRANFKGASLDAYAAAPLTERATSRKTQIGLTMGYGF